MRQTRGLRRRRRHPPSACHVAKGRWQRLRTFWRLVSEGQGHVECAQSRAGRRGAAALSSRSAAPENAALLPVLNNLPAANCSRSSRRLLLPTQPSSASAGTAADHDSDADSIGPDAAPLPPSAVTLPGEELSLAGGESMQGAHVLVRTGIFGGWGSRMQGANEREVEVRCGKVTEMDLDAWQQAPLQGAASTCKA